MKNLICRIMRYLSNIIEEIFTWCHTQITAPTLLTATVVPPNIILSWTDNATNNTCYMIWRSTDGTNFTLLETVSTADLSTWTDTTVVFDQDYWYKVQACDGSGDTSDFSNTVETSYSATEINYGILYNWWVASAANIAPAGWHVPTFAEVWDLGLYFEGFPFTTAGGKLKEIGLIYWNTPNTGATNEVGFNARGSGYRSNVDGSFIGIKTEADFWTSDTISPTQMRAFGLSYNSSSLAFQLNIPKDGYSIRLIKNDAINTGSVMDYDSNVYPTVTIGTQVWMAANLIVTHYNDGTPIPEVTDNATWTALGTGAWCAYDNDHNNI